MNCPYRSSSFAKNAENVGDEDIPHAGGFSKKDLPRGRIAYARPIGLRLANLSDTDTPKNDVI